MGQKVQVKVMLEPDVYLRLVERAKAEGRSLSQMAARALTVVLDPTQRPLEQQP